MAVAASSSKQCRARDTSPAKLFRSLKGRFWVDQRDRLIMKGEAEVLDTIRQALAHLELSGISIVLQFGRNTGT
jgi:hypothetical protein